MKSPNSPKSLAIRATRMVLAIILAFVALGGQTLALAERVNKNGVAFPKVKIPKVAKGEEITTALGASIDTVGAWYGQGQSEFRTLIKRDKTMRADKSGRLHYVCASLALDPNQAGGGNNTGVAAPFPESQTFLLHSRPGATKVIYLDFNGHTTIDTEWNICYTDGAAIVTPPYDTDNNPSAFSSQELANIQVIWQRVAEDYAAFEVDVTTQDPGVAALQKTSPSDVNFGKRVCIGGSSMDWMGTSAGGFAYLNSFDWDIDTPAFVFPAQLGAGAPRYVAEAISHESGHTFGLHHDGTTAGVEYYQGNADWAPIMGVGYYSNIVLWSKGEYTGANNTEDDLAMIASYAPLRADTVGNTMTTASALTGTNPSVTGLIENRTDVDVYSFSTGAGSITLSLNPGPSSGNLYGQLTLYDATGAPVTTSLPMNTTAGVVTLNRTVAQGSYFVAIDGVGFGSPSTTGFSDYSSIGQYTLSATLASNVAGVAPVANAHNSTPLSGALPLTVGFTSSGSYDSDGIISSFNWNFGDGTPGSTASSPSHVYTAAGTYTASLTVTDNSGLSSTDSVIVNVSAPPIANAKSSAPLKGKIPLAVNFSSAGSSDPDGTITGYSWNFGNGATSTAANPAYTYASAGNYNATLTVTDNAGISRSDTVSVHAAAANAINVYDIQMSTAFASGKFTAKATVTVKDINGNLKSGASVKGNWTGAYVRSGVSATTGANGTCTLTSSSTTIPGPFTFAVTGITLSGFVYDALMNTVTSASIIPPPNVLAVSNIAMSSAFASGAFTSKATITVVNPLNGSPIAGALVKGNWSGATSAAGVSATTGTNGTCVLTSAATATRGTFTFTVTGITLTGYTYDATKNTVTSAAILPPPNEANVSAITMSTNFASGLYSAKATINVKNLAGAAVAGAVVKGNWTGATSATGVTATTDASGNCILTSATTATTGTFTFTVTGITLAGFTYDPAKNVISTKSITPPPNEVNVYDIAMKTTVSKGTYKSTATITVKDLSGNPRTGAVVKGNWSGVVNATGVSATTGTAGTCVFTSPTTKTKGTFTFTVTGVTLTSFTYDPAKNTITSKSITPP